MDLNTVRSFRRARSRADLALDEGERVVAGGTWLFSEPQVETTGLVDLTALGWPALEYTDGGLRIGATCTDRQLVATARTSTGWTAQPLFFQCASALLASFKVWNVATVGGNICRSFSAAAHGLARRRARRRGRWCGRPDGGDYTRAGRASW